MEDLLRAHKILMQSLLTDNGSWRNTAVGILKSSVISHIAPPAKIASKMPADSSSRLSFSKSSLQNFWFNRKNYMNIQQDISTSTASRGLAYKCLAVKG